MENAGKKSIKNIFNAFSPLHVMGATILVSSLASGIGAYITGHYNGAKTAYSKGFTEGYAFRGASDHATKHLREEEARKKNFKLGHSAGFAEGLDSGYDAGVFDGYKEALEKVGNITTVSPGALCLDGVPYSILVTQQYQAEKTKGLLSLETDKITESPYYKVTPTGGSITLESENGACPITPLAPALPKIGSPS
ncbi:MAG: hypothetical protein COB76_04065 [Alphaproteobacteria bacterium]|nr:MAG: hypothetical protein COB76_04065 [Alphaproteobacteria bacterium]